MSDTISIQGLEVWTHLGVPKEERAQAQRIEVSTTFTVTTVAQAAREDDLKLTVNYFEVARAIQRVAQNKERQLIETLAEDLTATLLHDFQLQDIELEIRKFIIPECNYISLKIKRQAAIHVGLID
jgi:7,8-dihydroneopterin aldolase/epimerase/oxygenase